MKIYWLDGGLKIEPDSERESRLLSELCASVRFEPVELPERKHPVDSGSQGLIDAIIRDLRQKPPDAVCLPEAAAVSSAVVRTAKIIPLASRRGRP
jgi:hypothetical protein